MLIDKLTRDANYGADLIVHKIDNPENATFKITDTELHVPVVTLHKAFRKIKMLNGTNMSVQSNNNNLNYLIDPTFTNVIDYLYYHLKELKKMM